MYQLRLGAELGAFLDLRLGHVSGHEVLWGGVW